MHLTSDLLDIKCHSSFLTFKFDYNSNIIVNYQINS